MFKAFGAFAFLAVLINVAIFATIGWVAWHFISKFW